MFPHTSTATSLYGVFKGTVSELLLTLWRSCRVSVCFCLACRSYSPTRTACLPDLRNQTTNTRTIARQRLNELISILMSPNQTQRQTLFWCKPAEEKRHTHTISSEHFGFLQVIFKKHTISFHDYFLPYRQQFSLRSNNQSAETQFKQRKLFWTMIRSQTSGRRVSSELFWNVSRIKQPALQQVELKNINEERLHL